MHNFERDGLTHIPNACTSEQADEVQTMLAQIPLDSAGSRLFGVVGLGKILSSSGYIGRHPAMIDGQSVFPVRAVYFDKNHRNNWGLGWHQDRTIAVKRRVETEGYGPWTVKAGLQHVAPPIEVLERMLTLRFHLDDVPLDNAPLLAASGSHGIGRIAEGDIDEVLSRCNIVECVAARGDIWIYPTPILHASEPSKKVGHRRVLQVDYAFEPLAGDLEWLGIE
jgi:Phytanoyl-CoA dioxygenase (PhyH)